MNSSELNEMIGFVGITMASNIVDDLVAALSRRNDKNVALVDSFIDGYVLAISRLVELEVGWNCIVQSYGKCKQDIPEKYKIVFNKGEK